MAGQGATLRDDVAARVRGGREMTTDEIVDHLRREGWVGVRPRDVEFALTEIGARSTRVKGVRVWRWRPAPRN